ncbi:MAG: sigma-70 family RNA polymerase sigma factor [Gemmataceae bacterium]
MRRLFRHLQQPTAAEPSDHALLQRFVDSRDEAAFELVVRRHAVLVAGVCSRIVRDPHLAEDATQAVFLILARKADSLRGTNVAGWLFRVSRRVSMRAKRTTDRRREREASLTAEPPAPLAVHPAEHAESLAVLDEEIARLPERFRLPVLLCTLGGITTDDAARTLGCPRGTVLSRLAAARSKLAAGLARRGFALPIGVVLAEVARPSNIAAIVPSLVRRAAAFRFGAAAECAAPQLLANGVLTAMKTTKLLLAAGFVLAAIGLAGGYSVLAVGAGEESAPIVVAVEQPRVSPKPALPPSKFDDTVRELFERASEQARRNRPETRRLEELIDKLRAEIETHQRNADLMIGPTDAGAMISMQSSLTRLEENIFQTQQEVDELEARLALLKKRFAAGLPPPTAAEIEAIVNADPEVSAAAAESRKLKLALAKEEGAPATPTWRDLQGQLARAEIVREKFTAAARVKAVASAKDAALEQFKSRIALLEEQLEEKKAVLIRRQQFRDSHQKVLTDARKVERVRKELDALVEPHREALKKAMAARLELNLDAASSSDLKLDAVLRELRELRAEVKQLREKK